MRGGIKVKCQNNIFIGNSCSNGIYHYKLVNESLIALKNIIGIDKCTYLCKYQNFLYGVLEHCDGQIFSYDLCNNKLQKININGSGPCHISISKDGRYLCISNYVDGHKQVYKVNDNGTIGSQLFFEDAKSEKSRSHYMAVYNGLIYAVDIGESCINVYNLNEDNRLVTSVYLGENVEPRHLCFHNDFIFAVTEKSCRLYTLKMFNNKLDIVSFRSILPKFEEQKDTYTGGAIKISDDGKFIYVTIRNHNSISVFKNNNGKIKFIQNVSSHGELPWDVEIGNKGKNILVANSLSNDVCVYKRNRHSGKIKFVSSSSMNSPSCILVG